MSVSLQKGQKISLTKGNEGLSKVIIGLGSVSYTHLTLPTILLV